MKYKFLFFVVCFFAAVPGWGQIITTICGTDTAGYNGDNIPAVDAELNYPIGIIVDNYGNIYIADQQNNRIRKINTAGIITTVAGTGVAGYNGDGIQATSAQLHHPTSIAINSIGELIIGDLLNYRIRIVDTTGIITTICGTGIAGFNGNNAAVDTATISDVNGIVADTAGNIYFSDNGGAIGKGMIREIFTDGIITTIAGTGTTHVNGIPATDELLWSPGGVALDGIGNIYFTDYGSNSVKKIDNSGIITTIAGLNGPSGKGADNIPATASAIDWPYDVKVDAAGDIYFSDVYNNRVRKVDASGIVTTIAGDGTTGFSGDGGDAISAELLNPDGIAIDNKNSLYIADWGNSRIRYVQNTLGINETTKNINKIMIYPNPSNGLFTINISSGINEDAQVVITNELGQKVKELKVATNQVFPVSMDVPDGLYFLTAHINNEIVSKKIEIVR